MADLFNKHIKKATTRTKEKLLEGIGKAKATQDEVFDQHAANLQKQSKNCEKLHKDVKAYSAALKTLISAERSLRDTIRENYEPDWPEREHLTALFDNLDIQSNDLEKAVCEDLPQSVSQYVQQFADLKKKVDKRGRKLVDYDHAKNQFSSAKASSKKGDSDPKVAKAQTELQQAQELYLEINRELLEILPATYDSRITFFVDTLQSLFNAQSIYQTEAARIHKQIVSQLDRLGESMDYLRVPRPEPRSVTPLDGSSGGPTATNTASPDNASRQSTPSPVQIPVPQSPPMNGGETPQQLNKEKEEEKGNPFGSDENVNSAQEEKFENKVYPKLAAAPPPPTASPRSDMKSKAAAPAKPKREKDPTNPFDESEEEDNVAPENPNAPPGVTAERRSIIYTVISTHEYKAVDPDELSFPAGEKIKVLESKPNDELDDGWKIGELSNGKRGVFPENFTKKP